MSVYANKHPKARGLGHAVFGIVGGLVGPFLIGYIKDQTGSFSLGIVAIGCGPLIAMVVAATLRSARKFEQPAAFDASGARS